MTSRAKKQGNEAHAPEVSTSAPLPFDPATLAQGVRVSQADFARLVGVSRQTVSQWVRKGKIQTAYPDGSLDPARAARDVIRNTKPSQLRAKVFKVATEDAQALRIRLADDHIDLPVAADKTAQRIQCNRGQVERIGTAHEQQQPANLSITRYSLGSGLPDGFRQQQVFRPQQAAGSGRYHRLITLRHIR